MKIYVIFSKGRTGEMVTRAFTDEETAKNYCEYWSEPEDPLGYMYYYKEIKLDENAEIYKNNKI